ncbi:MAG: folate-binding protein [Pseudomonadota bacterium]
MPALLAEDRTVLRLGGADARKFLQDLVTNDVSTLAEGPVYAAILSPQGKYLFDFFLVDDGETVLLDVVADRAPDLAKRLALYRLRADVTVEETSLRVALIWGEAPIPGAVPDPRHPALGARLYAEAPAIGDLQAGARADYDALRVTHLVPETGVELQPDATYILEAGFDRLHGVDFRKGCYVGQEVTARMHHKTELKKGLVRVAVEGPAPPPGTEVTADGRAAGTLFTTADGTGLAHLRFDRATGEMQAGAATLRRL